MADVTGPRNLSKSGTVLYKQRTSVERAKVRGKRLRVSCRI